VSQTISILKQKMSIKLYSEYTGTQDLLDTLTCFHKNESEQSERECRAFSDCDSFLVFFINRYINEFIFSNKKRSTLGRIDRYR